MIRSLLLFLWGLSALADNSAKPGVGETALEFERHYSLPPLTACRINPAPIAGTDTMLATIALGAGKFFTIVGLRQGRIVDYRSIPLDGAPSPEGCTLSCVNKEVNLTCKTASAGAKPSASAPPRKFRYFWNGKDLTLIRRTGPDETESAVQALFEEMHRGEEPSRTCEQIAAIPHIDQLTYSGPDRLHGELDKSIKDARKLAKSKQFTAAARMLALAFSTTTRLLCCSGWLACPDKDTERPAAWVAARVGGRNLAHLYRVAYPVPDQRFLDALETYGRYLAESGEQLRAIEIFRLALERDANRSSAHLGLADSLWAAGDRLTAATEYQRTWDLASRAGKSKKLPKYVSQRAKTATAGK